MEWTTRETSNRHRTRREREREREVRRGEERRKKRGALKATVCLGFLSPCRDRQVHHHTRAPHEIHKPTGGAEIPVGGKIPSEIRRSKSLRPRSAPPSSSRIPQIPAEIPQSSVGRRRRRLPATDPPPRRSRSRGFPPEVFRLSPSLLLPPRIVATGPSSGTFSGPRGQGLPSAEIPSRREEAHPLSRRPRALLVLEWRGGWRSTRAWIDSSRFGGFHHPVRKINPQRCTSSLFPQEFRGFN